MEIGTKVKKAREEKGYSQEKMAEILGISQSKYHRFESDKTLLNWDKIPVLSETLDIEVSELIPIGGKVLYIHKPDNQSGYIENLHNSSNEKGVKAIQELYEKMLAEKDKMYQKMLEEKNETIAVLKSIVEKK